MMRPLRMSLVIASLLSPFAACADGSSHERAGAEVRDSSLARDIRLAEAGLPAARPFFGRDTAVTDSPGSVDWPEFTPPEDGAPAARNASNDGDGAATRSCASPSREDQRRCLLAHLAESDAMLDRNYRALIEQLRDEAGAKARATEPPTVQRLRKVQRAWLVYRDDECRRRTRDQEGPLWAPERAACLAEYSALRARELEDALAERRALAPRDPPAASKRTIGRGATSRQRGGRG